MIRLGIRAKESFSAENGATVESPVEVALEAEGFTLEPAGDVRDGAGHFHLMVDAGCLAPDEQIPDDGAHRHLADGRPRPSSSSPPASTPSASRPAPGTTRPLT